MRRSTHPRAEYERLFALNDGLPLMHPKGKRVRYREQMKQAERRGIAWEFTFEEWVVVWNESGKWSERGIRKGQYLMARHGDTGPYRKDNVSIVPNAVNTREGVAKRPKPYGNTSRMGTGKGYYRRVGRFDWAKPFVAKFRNEQLGYFATEEEARAAYLAALAEFTAVGHPLQSSPDLAVDRTPFGSAHLLKG